VGDNLDWVLFMLRVVSASILLILLGILFWFILREYRAAVHQADANQRAYGSLIALRETDQQYVLTGDIYPLLVNTSLGRSPTNTIIVDDTFASSEHALITRRNGQWWLEDRRSRNGTTLNGTLVSRAIVITHGDVIGIGRMRYRVDLESHSLIGQQFL
jgi:hypothetical protein